MKTLREYVEEAKENKVAIGHFNISNLEGLWGVFNSAKSLNLPVIIGLSEGERDYVGARQAVALVKSLREQHNFPIFINADHTHSFEKVKEAVDLGFDAVMYDGTEFPINENIENAKKCVDYARQVNPDILVESELGFIGNSSRVFDSLPKDVDLSEENMTKPDDAKNFVFKTGVDMLAPSVGNVHGMFKGGKDPALNIKRIKEISESTGLPLVLHGGSGNSSEDFVQAINSGVCIVHVSTELRSAYKKALQMSLQDNPDEYTPYKILKPAMQAIEKVVTEKLKIFNKIN